MPHDQDDTEVAEVQHITAEDELRPELPPRPAQTSPLLSPPPVSARSQSSNSSSNGGNDFSIRRKPLQTSIRSEDRAYDPIALDSIGANGNPFDDDDNESEQDWGRDYKNVDKKEFGSPKAFYKTHLLFGYDLGYWRMPVRHGGIFTILFLSTFLASWYAGNNGFSTIQDVSGPFTVDCGGGQSGWTFVGLNIRFGELSFGAAKSIDLAWNWIVGRGLQALLSLLAFRVFQDALLRVAETTPLSYELYAALALYSTKPDMLWQLCIGIARYGKWRAKFIFVWIFISTVFLVAFPSLLDLCSGYDTLYHSNFKWPDGIIQSTDGLANGVWQTNSDVQTSARICCQWPYTDDAVATSNVTCYNSRWADDETYVNGTYQLSAYYNCTTGYSRDIMSNTTIVYYWNDTTLNTSWWNEFAIDQERASQYVYWTDWNFYPVMKDNFPCVAEPGTYQFGFSFEWLFVSTILTSCWLYGLWFLWLDCDVNSEFCRKRRRLGLWRAIADISEAMREELGPNICAYTEQELSDALKTRPPIKYYARRGGEGEPGHIGLSSRPSGRLRLLWNYEYGKDDDHRHKDGVRKEGGGSTDLM